MIAHGVKDGAPAANAAEASAEPTPMTTAEATKQIASNTEEVRQMRTSVGQHAAMLANNSSTLADHTKAMSSLQSSFNKYQQETNQSMLHMRTEYSSGIASAIAIGQINPSADGFSIGAGYGSFNGESETAFGLGYGVTLANGSRFQLSAGKNDEATGAGVMFSF
jgi:hypothetical protein